MTAAPTVTREAPKLRQAAPAAPRDRSVDVLRAGSLVLVVLLHATMVGVTVSGGAPVFENALETAWFAPVSWLVQMMPLFFLAGGFTAAGSWRRARGRGVSAAGFVAGRLHRLLAPTAISLAAIAAGLATLALCGVPADIIATAGFRVSQPLWFLGVFVLVQSLVPVMVALHERHRLATPALLAALVIGIDVARFATGIEAIGFLNLGAVWLLVQQLGFWDADGLIDMLAPATRWAVAGGAAAAIAALVTAGPYAADGYVNLNPPTLVLVLLGVAQLALFSLARGRLRVVAAHPVVGAVVDGIASRAMTIYLWHMPVLIGLAGASVLLAQNGTWSLPELHSGAWWITRPAWLLVSVAAVAAVALLAGRFERGRAPQPSGSPLRVGIAAVLGVCCIAMVFVLGLSWFTAAASALVATAAISLAGDFPRRNTGGSALFSARPIRQAREMAIRTGAHA
ncbi:MAG: acyltransferase family protein [Microbacterium sp.]